MVACSALAALPPFEISLLAKVTIESMACIATWEVKWKQHKRILRTDSIRKTTVPTTYNEQSKKENKWGPMQSGKYIGSQRI